MHCPALPGADWAGVRCHMWRPGPAVVMVTTGNVLRLISGPVVSLVAGLMWSPGIRLLALILALMQKL